ncbi:MAG: imidazolonepropionase [Rhodoluna sp.]
MSSVIFTDIATLVTNDPEVGSGLLGESKNQALVVESGKIIWIGDAKKAPSADKRVSLLGKTVIPGFVDSHAHMVFAGDRSGEFSSRMAGTSYSAGGMMSTVEATRAASDKELDENLANLAIEMYRSGITTFETKSGYGLTVEDELRALKIATQHTEDVTFLGAHVVPEEFHGREDRYVDLVCSEMIQACAPYAKWIDVFCDKGAFDYDQAKVILQTGIANELQPRIHANQISSIGAIQLAVELDCASADHLTHLSHDEIDLLANSQTVATLLPGAEFSTRSSYPDARRLFDAGVTVALATDCNPGSSFTTSMPFCIALAVREMHFTIEQAVWAATLGGAKALRRDDVGQLKVGSSADFVVLDAPSYLHLAYRPGVDIVSESVIAGTSIYRSNK